jgi:hypothetical protein
MDIQTSVGFKTEVNPDDIQIHDFIKSPNFY